MLDSRRVGHAGTLDPLAEGVLVVATGKCTKLLPDAEKSRKTYLARVYLGATSSTDDAEGLIAPSVQAKEASLARIKEVSSSFVGSILQRPPQFSALKIRGRRAYDLARKGIEIEMEPRRVDVFSIVIVSYLWPHLELRVETGKGVYIRSLARDIGHALGTGGYLEGLVRERVGAYGEGDCVRVDDLRDFLARS